MEHPDELRKQAEELEAQAENLRQRADALESDVSSTENDAETRIDGTAAHLAQLVIASVFDPAQAARVGTVPVPVRKDVERFHRQYLHHTSHRTKMPCLAVPGEEPTPVDLDWLMGRLWTDLGARELRPLRKQADEMLGAMAERGTLERSEHAPHDALALVRSALKRFLRPLVCESPPPPPPPPGNPPARPPSPKLYAFQVHTRSSGLTIYRSPAYLWDLASPFTDDLTTPVSGNLPSGLWRFGVEGDDLPLTPDATVYEVPRLKVARLRIA